MKKLIWSLCVIFMISGCATSPVKKQNGQDLSVNKDEKNFKIEYKPGEQVLPQHIKKIVIRPIVNQTTQIGLEDKFYLELYRRFIQDTKITVTDEDNADGAVVTEIVYYNLQPTGYGSNFEVTSYRLRVLVNLYFIDKIRNITLFEEKGFEGVHMFQASTMPGGITEEKAREYVWELLAQKIYRRVIEGFGSESGISERKIPK